MRQQAKAQQRMVLLVLIANPLEPIQHRHQALHRQTAIMSGLLVAAITVLRAIMKVCLQHRAKSGLWTIRRFGVQDSAAWDESIPTYGYEEKSICNVCGSDITGNKVTHGKAHMVAGEGSGHHTEMVQVVTGSQIVHHDATGHYETVESGGHWE